MLWEKIKKAKIKVIILYIYIIIIKYVLLSSFPIYFSNKIYYIKNKIEIYSYIPCIFQCTVKQYQLSSKLLQDTSKFFLNQTNNKKLLKQILTKKNFKITKKCKYLHVREVYVSKDCIFGDSHIFVDLSKKLSKIKKSSLIGKDFEIIKNDLNNSIALTHKERMTYPDIFLDFMFPLMLIPEKLWNQSTFIVPFSTNPFLYQIAQIISPNISIIRLKKNQFVYTHNLMTIIDPIPSSSSSFVLCGSKYSKFIRNKLNLTQIKPTDYSLCNRNSRYNKTISNFNQIFIELNNSYPELKWKIIDDVYNSFQTTAKVWASLKVLFTVSGKNLVKMIAMQEKTAICVVSSDKFNYEMAALSQVLNIVYFCYFDDNFKENQKHVELDINNAIQAIDSTIYVYKHKKWRNKIHKTEINFNLFY